MTTSHPGKLLATLLCPSQLPTGIGEAIIDNPCLVTCCCWASISPTNVRIALKQRIKLLILSWRMEISTLTNFSKQLWEQTPITKYEIITANHVKRRIQAANISTGCAVMFLVSLVICPYVLFFCHCPVYLIVPLKPQGKPQIWDSATMHWRSRQSWFVSSMRTLQNNGAEEEN